MQGEDDGPVDIDEDRTEGEGRREGGVLAPDGAVRVPARGRVPGVVDVGDVHQQPGDEGQDLVGQDGAGAMLLPLGEGIVCACCQPSSGEVVLLVEP